MGRASTPEPRMDQWWADNDKRCRVDGAFMRVGKIVDVREHPTKGVQFLMAWRLPPRSHPGPRGDRRASRSWVSVKRFKPRSTGYVYLGTGYPRAGVGPADVESAKRPIVLRFCKNCDYIGNYWENGDRCPKCGHKRLEL